ncbi:hypothetical protein [Spirosoma sp. 48-14]|uniref:hypothetical protein n=1 Tax=Spirosoma sp. 48-14 TaxID=1895854 RepID=UPI00095D7D35|nr:hypothetical protein [Spirosoma sp. 48-14]OJW78449.1 MAG: hypothetical protein BGO59_31085 [Spirosoma sp. 48-14]
MNTEQSYCEGGDSTTSNPQTAQNTAQTAYNPDRGQFLDGPDEYFVEIGNNPGASEYLRSIIHSVRNFSEKVDPTTTLVELCNDKLTRCAYLDEREKRKVENVLSLIGFINKLRSDYENFAIWMEEVEGHE